MEDEIRKVLDRDIKPALEADGGSIELVSVQGGTVKVRLKGACSCCPSASVTMAMGVEKILKSKVPGVQKVLAVQ